jgi:hypothetical protein
MGLNTSYGAWDGAYSSFHRWRVMLASKIGINLEDMEGFGFEYGKPEKPRKDLSWEPYLKHNLYPLLMHSDCDGKLKVSECKKIKKGLEDVIKDLPKVDMDEHQANFKSEEEWFVYKAQLFIDGCTQAIKEKKPIEFH